MEWNEGMYKISNDKSLLSIKKISNLLSKSYWASKRTMEVIQKSIDNSICYGVYYNDEQIGYGRIITDYATTYYICDIIIDENHRGKRLGRKLIECMIEFEDFGKKFGILSTRDAHDLYKKYGFRKDNENFMYRVSIK
ncbi:GNAT family N-acetyltransferase [Clostridium sp.]|uniref:GNAT family N-acetyltransferase n=1 Tax=Clostridium sp. TaxID=1506 RepID=UPI003217EED7